MTDYIGLKLDSGRGRASQQARVVLVFCAARTCETDRCAQLPWYRGVSILAPPSFRNSLLSLIFLPSARGPLQGALEEASAKRVRSFTETARSGVCGAASDVGCRLRGSHACH